LRCAFDAFENLGRRTRTDLLVTGQRQTTKIEKHKKQTQKVNKNSTEQKGSHIAPNLKS
jgi:hypothetical protein